MLLSRKKKILKNFTKIVVFSLIIFVFPFGLLAEKPTANVEVSLSPSGSPIEEGSTFQVPISINTNGKDINAIDIKINFDHDKLNIINSGTGNSIIGIWTEPPKYDNTQGSASYTGVVPGGIRTGSGMIGKITFKALASGKTNVDFAKSSTILLNDGYGTKAETNFFGASYDISPKTTKYIDNSTQTSTNLYTNYITIFIYLLFIIIITLLLFVALYYLFRSYHKGKPPTSQ